MAGEVSGKTEEGLEGQSQELGLTIEGSKLGTGVHATPLWLFNTKNKWGEWRPRAAGKVTHHGTCSGKGSGHEDEGRSCRREKSKEKEKGAGEEEENLGSCKGALTYRK